MAASFAVEFDLRRLRWAILILLFAFTQGVFPKPPDFSKLPAFDLAFFASHPRFTLFLLTVLGIARARRLRAAVGARAGVLGARAPGPDDPARPPALPARGLRGPVRRLAASASRRSGSCSRRSTSAARCATCCSCSASTRWRPPCRSRRGGAGVQQALLVKVFAGTASGATVAAYSVGQQIAIGALTFGVGFAARSCSSSSFRSLQGGRSRRGPRGRARPRTAAARSLRPRLGTEALARLAHERDGLGEDRRAST